MKPDRGGTEKMMHSFQDLQILSCWGCPSPSSSRLSRPLLGIPGQNRPGDLHLVSPEPLVPTPPHPMILLQVGDHRLDARSGGEQPLEPSGIFVGYLGLAFSGDGDLRDPGEVRGVFVSCEPYPRSAARAAGRPSVAFSHPFRESDSSLHTCCRGTRNGSPPFRCPRPPRPP